MNITYFRQIDRFIDQGQLIIEDIDTSIEHVYTLAGREAHYQVELAARLLGIESANVSLNGEFIATTEY